MMILADTSVLAAASWQDDQRFAASQSCLTRLPVAISTHSLAELYATLTAIPRPWRFTVEEAEAATRAAARRFQTVALEAEDYTLAIGLVRNNNLGGGAIYDALIARCAVKCEAERLYTWNPKHFLRFGPPLDAIVRQPEITA